MAICVASAVSPLVLGEDRAWLKCHRPWSWTDGLLGSRSLESEQCPNPKPWLPHLWNGDKEVYASVPLENYWAKTPERPHTCLLKWLFPFLLPGKCPFGVWGTGKWGRNPTVSAHWPILPAFRFPFLAKALKKNFPLKMVNVHSHCDSLVFPYLPFKILILAFIYQEERLLQFQRFKRELPARTLFAFLSMPCASRGLYEWWGHS